MHAWKIIAEGAFALGFGELIAILYLRSALRKARRIHATADQGVTTVNVLGAIHAELAKDYKVFAFYRADPENDRLLNDQCGGIPVLLRNAATKALWRGRPFSLDRQNSIDAAVLAKFKTSPLTFVPIASKAAVPCWDMHGCADNSCACHGKRNCRCWLESDRRFRGEEISYPEKMKRCFCCKAFLPAGAFLIQGVMTAGKARRLNSRFAGILRSAMLYEEAHHSATIDYLTGVPNNGNLMDILPHLLNISLRLKEDLCVVMFDIDHFKKFNDTYGHQTGDVVLRGLAQFVQGRLGRVSDVIGRYGGEEFMIILPNTKKQDGLRFVTGIRKDVEAHTFTAEAGDLHVTISMGLAACPTDATTVADIIKKADVALYRAKKTRNTATAFTEEG